MAKLIWDAEGTHFFETGVDHGVLYVAKDSGGYENGIVWNGLTAVTESPSGAEASPLYADNIKYLNLMSVEELGATIEAYYYPDEFMQCDGSAIDSTTLGLVIGQQKRKKFALAYRTRIGNDTLGDDFGYKLHLLYGCLASPSERAYNTVNDSPEANTLSWEVTTTPVPVGEGYRPTSLLTIDSTKFKTEEEKAKLTLLENELYGTDPDPEASSQGTPATMPLPARVMEILKISSAQG